MKLSTILLCLLLILAVCIVVKKCSNTLDDCYDTIDGHTIRVWCTGLPSKGQ